MIEFKRILIRVITSLFCFLSVFNHAVEGQSAKSDYLVRNSFPLNMADNGDYSSFAPLDSVVKNYSLFFLGEASHFLASNSKTQLKFLKYLYKTAGVRNLILEYGYSEGYLFNEYLKSGNENMLEGIAQFRLPDYKEFWKQLFLFNRLLPEDAKINVIGLDFERSEAAFRALCQLLPDKDPPVEISRTIGWIRKLNISEPQQGYEFRKRMKQVKKSLNRNKDIFRNFLGNNFFHFDMIVNNPAKRPPVIGILYTQRDKAMYKNFLKIYPQKKGEKFFTQMGNDHTLLNRKSVARLTQNMENSPVHRQVMIINGHIENCTESNYGSSHYVTQGVLDIKKYKKEFSLSKFAQTEFTFFNFSNARGIFGKATEECKFILYAKNQHGMKFE